MTIAVRATTYAAALCATSALCLSCGLAQAAPWKGATPQTWPRLRASLDDRRAARPREPWAAGLRVTMREPHTGRVVDGRGAIAVSPGQAVRMILIGGAGATILDAWVTRDRWRVAVPPLDLVRRGGAEEPRDMPVGFLRWWFLTPLGGTLFAASDGDAAERGPIWLLRDGRSVVELREGTCEGGQLLRATRRIEGHAETVDECRLADRPRVGDTARYVDESSGLRVEVAFESIASEPPDPAAFRDPDAEGSGS